MDSDTQALRDRIQVQLESLPAARVAEVGDFVDFLAKREIENNGTTDARLARETSALTTTSFDRVWDNPEDAAYDRL